MEYSASAKSLLFTNVSLLLIAAGGALGQSKLASSTPVSTGGRVDYLPSINRLAYDKTSADGLFDTYTMAPNGTGKVCLTCGYPAIAQSHNGNPAWHPSGQYILFQVHDASLPVLPVEWVPITYRVTNPGYGTNNNLWLMSADGSQYWQLTHVEAGNGLLHASFDKTGTKVVWAEKIGYTGPDQQWVIKVADFVWTDGVPELANQIVIAPFGSDTFYETYGFSPDGKYILFAGGSPSQITLNLFLYSVQTGNVKNLTNSGTGIWNEHAHFTPDGKRIIFGSSRDITLTREYYVPFTDYWMMNLNGTNPVRLTYFNDPAYPEFFSFGLVAADFTFTGSAAAVFAGLQQNQPIGDHNVYYIISVLKFAF